MSFTRHGEDCDLAAADLATLRENARKLLNLASGGSTPCIACKREIWFVRHSFSGKFTPYTDELTSHFLDCPHRNPFRVKARGKRLEE